MKRLYSAILHAIWAYKNPQTLQKCNFKMLSDLLVMILKVQNEDRHIMCNIAFVHPTEGQKQIASVWVGAGIDSDPVKRIGELLFEIEKLKKELAKNICFENNKIDDTILHETSIRERMKVEIYNDLLIELYDFAYEQAVKTNTVEKLHDIDRRINGPDC